MKKILLYACLVVVIFGALLFSITMIKEPMPPTPKVEIGGKTIEVVQGSYCWENWLKGICADMAMPEELARDVKISIASPGDEVSISFDKTPNEKTLSASIYAGPSGEADADMKNGVVRLPKEKGIYIYVFSAGWEKGSAAYVFSVNVQ